MQAFGRFLEVAADMAAVVNEACFCVLAQARHSLGAGSTGCEVPRFRGTRRPDYEIGKPEDPPFQPKSRRSKMSLSRFSSRITAARRPERRGQSGLETDAGRTAVPRLTNAARQLQNALTERLAAARKVRKRVPDAFAAEFATDNGFRAAGDQTARKCCQCGATMKRPRVTWRL